MDPIEEVGRDRKDDIDKLMPSLWTVAIFLLFLAGVAMAIDAFLPGPTT